MRQLIRTSLTAAAGAVAILLATPLTHAQPVAGTEAGVALSEAGAAGNALDFAAYGPRGLVRNTELICARLSTVRERKHTLVDLYSRASGHGQRELASRFADMIDDLIDLIEDVEYDFCPPVYAVYVPGGPSGGGFYLGFQGTTIDSFVNTYELFQGTDNVRMQFRDRRDPFGIGGLAGYKFMPWSNIVVSPFVSFDSLNATVGHGFPNGSFLGSTGNWDGTVGVKVGPQYQIVWLYGIAGLSVLNETLKVNFVPMASSTNQTVAGATVGAGVAFQPALLQGFGVPISVFLEYQHTWWQTANFNMPASSPGFNYNFSRDGGFIKFGLTVGLGGSSPTVAPVVRK